MAPLFTVLVVSHNRPQYLPQAVASIYAQTCCDAELVIVDDSNAPGVDAFLANVADIRCPLTGGLHVIRVPTHCTVDNKYNIGYQVARGRIIAHNEDDDESLPERLAVTAACFSRLPGLGLFSADAVHVDGDGTEVGAGGRYPIQYRAGGEWREIRMHGATAAYHADLARAHPRVWDWEARRARGEVSGGSDWPFYRSMMESGAGHHFEPQVLARYRVHPIQVSMGTTW